MIKTEVPVSMDIINKRVISGTLVPCKEVKLKTEIAGIIDKLYVSIGDTVAPGTSVARIKVLPKFSTIEAAKKHLHVAQIVQKEAAAKYQRSKQLFQQNMLSQEQYDAAIKDWALACAEVDHMKKDLNFTLRGHIDGTQGASNIVKSTIAGVVSELPREEGSPITERSNLREGSTIATISDMSSMLFRGQVGEMDVVQLRPGMQFEVSLLAFEGKKFPTTLTKIAPKAIESDRNSSIKFEIEGTVQIAKEKKANIRAGYTAIADIILEQAIHVLAIQEKYVHSVDADTQASTTLEKVQEANNCFVWVYENKQKVKKPVELGISDGIYVEIKKGLTAGDQVIIADDSY